MVNKTNTCMRIWKRIYTRIQSERSGTVNVILYNSTVLGYWYTKMREPRLTFVSDLNPLLRCCSSHAMHKFSGWAENYQIIGLHRFLYTILNYLGNYSDVEQHMDGVLRHFQGSRFICDLVFQAGHRGSSTSKSTYAIATSKV